MPSDLLSVVNLLAALGAVGLFLLALYQSFIVRRIMANRVYKSRALWTGAVSVTGVLAGLIIFIYPGLLGQSYPPFSIPSSPIFFAQAVVGTLVTFGWIDGTIGVARELDFFHTDRLGWRRYRKIAWVAEASVLTIPITATPTVTNPIIFVVVIALVGTPFVYAGLILARTAPHVHDATMREFFRWVGLYAAALVTAQLVFTITSIPVLFTGYFLYCAAKSLSVRSRLEPIPNVGTTSQASSATDGITGLGRRRRPSV